MTPQQLADIVWKMLDNADAIVELVEAVEPDHDGAAFSADAMCGYLTVGDTSVTITITPR